MIPEWLELDLPVLREHPQTPRVTWEEYVAFVEKRQRELLASGGYAALIKDFEETHRGEPFVWRGPDEPA